MLHMPSISAELLRDLMDCVQAGRDGTPETSLYARQCDLVLDKVAREVGATLAERTIRLRIHGQPPRRRMLGGGGGLQDCRQFPFR
jgi:hypothetical protein